MLLLGVLLLFGALPCWSSDERCAICHEEILLPQFVKETLCEHKSKIHVGCLDHTKGKVSSNSKCPYCGIKIDCNSRNELCGNLLVERAVPSKSRQEKLRWFQSELGACRHHVIGIYQRICDGENANKLSVTLQNALINRDWLEKKIRAIELEQCSLIEEEIFRFKMEENDVDNIELATLWEEDENRVIGMPHEKDYHAYQRQKWDIRSPEDVNRTDHRGRTRRNRNCSPIRSPLHQYKWK